MGWLIRIATTLSLLSVYPGNLGQADEEECCSTKVVKFPTPNPLDGVYTLLVSEGAKREDICIDGCVYTREGLEYCFISSAQSAKVECETDGTLSNEESLEALTAQKEEALEKITAAEDAIEAVMEAKNVLDNINLDLSIFGKQERFKRQDNMVSAPRTCAQLLDLLDDITETLRSSKPAEVRPFIKALREIKTPLDTPCSDSDIESLKSKLNDASAAANAALKDLEEAKNAAVKENDEADEKINLLNQQTLSTIVTVGIDTHAPTMESGDGTGGDGIGGNFDEVGTGGDGNGDGSGGDGNEGNGGGEGTGGAGTGNDGNGGNGGGDGPGNGGNGGDEGTGGGEGTGGEGNGGEGTGAYLIIVNFFTLTQFLELKFYT